MISKTESERVETSFFWMLNTEGKPDTMFKDSRGLKIGSCCKTLRAPIINKLVRHLESKYSSFYQNLMITGRPTS